MRAGVRSIEHGTLLSEPTLRLRKEENVWFVPTYSAMVDISDAGGDYDDPGLQIRGRFMLPQLQSTVRLALSRRQVRDWRRHRVQPPQRGTNRR